MGSPSLSPHQPPFLSSKTLGSTSLHSSPNVSPSLSPYQSPSPSPQIAFSESPPASLASPPFTAPLRIDQPGSDKKDEEATAGVDSNDEGGGINGEDGQGVILQMEAVCLKDAESCGSYGGREGAAERRSPQ